MSNANEPCPSRTAKTPNTAKTPSTPITSRPPRKGRGISLTIGGHTFPTKKAAKEFNTALRDAQLPGVPVAEPDHSFLCDLLARHPDAAEKIGSGVRHFTVESAKGGTQCFYVTRVDGSKIDFSSDKCLGVAQ